MRDWLRLVSRSRRVVRRIDRGAGRPPLAPRAVAGSRSRHWSRQLRLGSWRRRRQGFLRRQRPGVWEGSAECRGGAGRREPEAGLERAESVGQVVPEETETLAGPEAWVAVAAEADSFHRRQTRRKAEPSQPEDFRRSRGVAPPLRRVALQLPWSTPPLCATRALAVFPVFQ